MLPGTWNPNRGPAFRPWPPRENLPPSADYPFVCRWSMCRYRGNMIKGFCSHFRMVHLADYQEHHPAVCLWEGCTRSIPDEREFALHLIDDHLGYKGDYNYFDILMNKRPILKKPRNKFKQWAPPAKPCRWKNCSFKVGGEDTMELARHVISQHINRRNTYSSFSCEWDSCGVIFLNPRELADHLAKTHVLFFRLAVCFCGEVVGKASLAAHENACLVFKNNPAPALTAGQHLVELPETSDLPRPPKRSHDGIDNNTGPQPAANEPRKIQARKTGDATASIPSRIPSSTESVEAVSRTASESPSDGYMNGEKRPPPLPKNPRLRKLELQRIAQQKREQEAHQRHAEHRNQRRLERLQKEQQLKEQKGQELKEQQLKELELKEHQHSEDAQTNEDGQPGRHHQPHDQARIPPPPAAAATAVEAREDQEVTAAIARLHCLADDLLMLSNTISSAVARLPAGYMKDLSYELENDWAVQDMDQMLRGVLSSYEKGGDERWMSGERWRRGPEHEPEDDAKT